MTKNARRIIWRARWILLLHWLGKPTEQNLLDWARFIVRIKGMNQTRLGSFIEAAVNTAIGYLVALASQLVIFPLVGIDVEFSTNLLIGFWFTLISIARGYVLRRWFNARLHKAAQKLAGAVQ